MSECFDGTREEAKEQAVKALTTYAKCALDRVRKKGVTPKEKPVCLTGSFLKDTFGERNVDEWIHGAEEILYDLQIPHVSARGVAEDMKRIKNETGSEKEFKKELQRRFRHYPEKVKRIIMNSKCSDIDGAIEVKDMEPLGHSEYREIIKECNKKAREEVNTGKFYPSFGMGTWWDGAEECKTVSEWKEEF